MILMERKRNSFVYSITVTLPDIRDRGFDSIEYFLWVITTIDVFVEKISVI
jgi:hypothetical protein